MFAFEHVPAYKSPITDGPLATVTESDSAPADWQEHAMEQSPNQLLASLPAKVFASLMPHLRTMKLTLGDIAAEAGGEVKRAYFPHSGVISLVVELDSGQMVETAMIGCDGVLNASVALDGRISLNKAIVQLSGEASVIGADNLRKIANDYAPFRTILVRHDQVLFGQAQQSAACNASHSVESRMCRWLLRMRDLAGSDDLTLTQEFLAQMLGVRRPSVSIVAGTLQKAGLIRYRRGHIRILDVKALEADSCECYAAVKSYYARLQTA